MSWYPSSFTKRHLPVAFGYSKGAEGGIVATAFLGKFSLGRSLTFTTTRNLFCIFQLQFEQIETCFFSNVFGLLLIRSFYFYRQNLGALLEA